MIGDVAQFKAEFPAVEDHRINVGQFHHHPAQPVDIAFHHSRHQIDQFFGGLSIELAGHAAVDETQLAARQQKDIARMGIGMEEAETQTLLEDCIGAVGDDGPPLVRAQVLRGNGRQQPALDLLHGQDISGGCRPIDLGKTDVVIAFEIAAQPFGGLALDDQVDFLEHLPGKFLGDGRRTVAEIGKILFEELGQTLHQGHVFFDQLSRPGADNLDDYRLPSFMVARWTWAMEAAASGVSSMVREEIDRAAREIPGAGPGKYRRKGPAGSCPGVF